MFVDDVENFFKNKTKNYFLENNMHIVIETLWKLKTDSIVNFHYTK